MAECVQMAHTRFLQHLGINIFLLKLFQNLSFTFLFVLSISFKNIFVFVCNIYFEFLYWENIFFVLFKNYKQVVIKKFSILYFAIVSSR